MAPPPPPFCFSPARLRFPAGHPFFEDGDVERHLSLQGAPSPSAQAPEEEEEGGGRPPGAGSLFPCPSAGCGQTFRTRESAEHHYQLLHRHACAACRRPLPSAHLLHLHLLEWHDPLFRLLAQRQQQHVYQCLVESCTEKFKSSKDRKDHLIKVHRYPSDFRFDKPVRSKSTKPVKPLPGDHTVPMDVNTEASEQSPGEAMETGPSEAAADEALQPGMQSTWVLPPPETRPSRPRIPPSICFGQGATRSFKSRKKRA